MNKDLGVLGSSTDPTKLSAAVSGGIILMASFILMIAEHFNFPLTKEEIVVVAGQIGVAVGILYTLYGLVRKAVIAIHNKLG